MIMRRERSRIRETIQWLAFLSSANGQDGERGRVGRHKKEREEERRTIKDREQTDTH